ncbi:MAG: biotin--[acetyl-CoA-carboxylase] ligase [Phycisphaerae bacterium]
MPSGVIDIQRLRATLEPNRACRSIKSRGGQSIKWRVGRAIEWTAETDSTNDWAWEFIDVEAADGLVVVTEYQRLGRGRLGRSWISPRGASLLFSVLLIDEAGALNGGEIGLLAAVACAGAVSKTTQLICSIKWPNDLLVSGKKVGGILVESRKRGDGTLCYALGIGINCLQQAGHLPPALAGSATSLEIECAAAIDRTALLTNILKELDGWLADPGRWGYEDLHAQWLARCEFVGRRVELQHANRMFVGTMLDIDPAAALLVRLDEGGIRRFDASDTTVLSTQNP